MPTLLCPECLRHLRLEGSPSERRERHQGVAALGQQDLAESREQDLAVLKQDLSGTRQLDPTAVRQQVAAMLNVSAPNLDLRRYPQTFAWHY